MEEQQQRRTAWERQLLIRDKNRPTVRDYIPRIFTDFYEMHGDRNFGDDGTMNMPNYMQNYHFACRLQENMEGMFPGLTRPILFDYRHYNQDLTTGSLLLEVGTHGNTLEQAQYAGELVGKALSQTLLKLKAEE